MPSISPQDLVVTPDQLCIGLFVHIDLPWFSHPFSFNSFKIRSADQLKTLRGLGVTHFRYDPERSDVQPRGMGPAQTPGCGSGKGFREGRRRHAQHQQEPVLASQGMPRGGK